MERSPTVTIKSSNGRLSHVIDPTSYIPDFPHKPTNIDASFSSYLRPKDDPNNNFDESEISIFDAQKYFNESTLANANTTSDATKFGKRSVLPVHDIHNIARMSDQSAVPRFSSASSADGFVRNYRARSFHATPTASSEASWNSQTGLLSNPPGAFAVSMNNPNATVTPRASSSKWLFGRKCPCSGKKSVQVQDKMTHHKSPSHLISNPSSSVGSLNGRGVSSKTTVEIAQGNSLVTTNWSRSHHQVVTSNPQRVSSESRFPSGFGQQRVFAASAKPFSDGSGFTFPILNQSSSNKLVLKGLTTTNPLMEDPPRDSLDVFQPSDEPLSRKSLELQHRMMAPRRQSFTFPGSPKSRMTTTDDDVGSDASSDLFEIESFSTQTTSYPMYHRRDSLDEDSNNNKNNMGGIYYGMGNIRMVEEVRASTECYEPSEASIDWSVTTAEGFDRGSVTNMSISASEAGDLAMMRQLYEKSNRNSNNNSGKKRGSGGLLSCRCEKAVSIGPHPLNKGMAPPR